MIDELLVVLYAYRKGRRVRTGARSLFSARFFDNGKVAEVERHIFGSLSTRSCRKHRIRFLFGDGNLSVLEKSSAEKRSHPRPMPASEPNDIYGIMYGGAY